MRNKKLLVFVCLTICSAIFILVQNTMLKLDVEQKSNYNYSLKMWNENCAKLVPDYWRGKEKYIQWPPLIPF